MCPLCSPDLNLIKRLCSINKYDSNKQIAPKNEFCEVRLAVSEVITPEEIPKLTSAVSKRVEILRKNRKYISK